MHRDRISAALRAGVAVFAALMVVSTAARAADCPATGTTVDLSLEPSLGVPAGTATVLGFLTAPSCDDPSATLATTYADTVDCTGVAGECAARFAGLHPGVWTHRVVVAATGQNQGRRDLLLDDSAGGTRRAWMLYPSVATVTTLEDAPDCVGCLRAAVIAANRAPGPTLIQFAPDLIGSIRLQAALPSLATDGITIDALDADGSAHRRTLDGNGLSSAALRIVAAHCQILGLRVTNVGGDADAVLIDGVGAFDNVLDSLEIAGRSLQPCGTNGTGCIVDGVCREPSPQEPRGACGDDGIAVRSLAGVEGANLIRNCTISGARDKGVKVSEGGVAVAEDNLVFGNADGGLQATLSGELIARRNRILGNRGTTSASGLAANGAILGSSVPSRLTTRGNLSVGNALRGISVRSLSEATLQDDFLCGNGSGLALLDAAGAGATATASGLAIVHNVVTGVSVSNTSRLAFGDPGAPGASAVAFNGAATARTPANFRNGTQLPIAAVGNAWEHCGPRMPCDAAAVQALDVATTSPFAPVAIEPALPTRRRAAPAIAAIEPGYAAAGELVRIFGSGFDAIEGAGRSCASTAAANTCRPLQGNCVLVDRVPADVVAVTPTMLVIRAPFTCVAPVRLSVRTHWGHGFAHAPFCVVAPAAD